MNIDKKEIQKRIEALTHQKQEIEQELLSLQKEYSEIFKNVKVGDIIYAYDPNTNEKYSSSIGEIAINKFGITLNDIYSHTICPACKLDSNENWGPYLYFSSDKKRQEYIDNI